MHSLLAGLVEVYLAEVTMRRLVPVISLTMVVFLLCVLRSTRAAEFDAGLPQPAIRWLNDAPERQPGSVPAEVGTQDFTGAVQEDEGLPWGEGTQPQPHLLYAQWGPGGRRTIRCESDNNRYAYCPTYTNGRVRLQQQLSNAPCRQYETWGADGDGSGIWVRNGCRAIFVVRGGGGGGGWGNRTITCRSEHYRYNRCPAYVSGRKVRLSNQLSDASCVRGSSWGVYRDGIWVDNGCAAEFEIR